MLDPLHLALYLAVLLALGMYLTKDDDDGRAA